MYNNSFLYLVLEVQSCAQSSQWHRSQRSAHIRLIKFELSAKFIVPLPALAQGCNQSNDLNSIQCGGRQKSVPRIKNDRLFWDTDFFDLVLSQ